MISVSVPFMRYQGRWCVVRVRGEEFWTAWLGGDYLRTVGQFWTHAEAMTYADREARR
ncbi:MAG: hypothetical protein ACOH10_11285 [Rhodoglobus sp.]